MNYERFEKWVEKLITDLGYTNVERDVTLEKELDGQTTRYQIDIVYGRFWKHYVECKYREKNNVPLKEVAKFKSVMDLLGLPKRRGLVVTNQHFTQRARVYGERNGLELVDREKLLVLDRKRRPFLERFMPRDDGKSLEQLIRTA